MYYYCNFTVTVRIRIRFGDKFGVSTVEEKFVQNNLLGASYSSKKDSVRELKNFFSRNNSPMKMGLNFKSKRKKSSIY